MTGGTDGWLLATWTHPVLYPACFNRGYEVHALKWWHKYRCVRTCRIRPATLLTANPVGFELGLIEFKTGAPAQAHSYRQRAASPHRVPPHPATAPASRAQPPPYTPAWRPPLQEGLGVLRRPPAPAPAPPPQPAGAPTAVAAPSAEVRMWLPLCARLEGAAARRRLQG